jgi:hypothetical protein
MKSLYFTVLLAFMFVMPAWMIAQVADGHVVEKQQAPVSEFRNYSETLFASHQAVRATDSAISAMVAAISADTLRATLQEMQNWGSRFLMNDNEKEIATSLLNKFLSYGYTDVKLDSFYLIINWSGLLDSAWHYNIVCTMPGASAPEEIYVVGGHWDSISLPDPFNDAPGVNDNGTAVAATLEIARIMKLHDFKPEATIRFTLFAAEELGLFGARMAAAKASFGGDDVRYMLNMDMISNNPGNLPQVKVYQYAGNEWASFLAADAAERYTDLVAVIPQNYIASSSDSYPFYLMGFPAAYFEEYAFSPHWHKPSDTLGNCNVPYLTKITGGALATIAEQQLMPYPQKLSAKSTKKDVVLSWKPTRNSYVKGCNIYRSDNTGGQFEKITAAPVSDSTFHDQTALPNRQYFYKVTTVNNASQESMFSNEVSGVRFAFQDSLLVLANLKGNKTTPDSVFNYYKAILDTIPFVWKDINATQKVSLADFSRYRSILWMSNSIDFEFLTSEMIQGVREFGENGGNLLFAGFSPGRFWLNTNISYPYKAAPTSLLNTIFKVDTVDRTAQSMMFRANATSTGYMTLTVDSLKYLDKKYPGQIFMVDAFIPAPDGAVNYRFDSKYDSANILGRMKNRPVGLEYIGDDFKSILLSFPLYYLDTTDARDFLNFVMTKKFSYPVGIDPIPAGMNFDFQLYPNPVRDFCNLNFTILEPARVRLLLISSGGKIVNCWLDRNLEPGIHSFRVSTANLIPGLYEVVLRVDDRHCVKKIVVGK